MFSMRKIASVLVILLLPISANAGAFYADNVGPDTNLGTLASPVKTLSKLVSLVTSTQPGYLKAGVTWNERLNINKSGTAGNPLIFGRYGDAWLANPIIDGTGLANAVVYTANDYITLQDITVTGADVGRRNIYLDVGAEYPTLTRIHSIDGDQPLFADGVTGLLIQDSLFEGAEDTVSASSFWLHNTTGSINNTVFRPSAANPIRRIVLYGTGSNIVFRNDVLTGYVSDGIQIASGNTGTVYNSILVGNRDGGGFAINNSGTAAVYNSLWATNWSSQAAFNGTVTQSNNIDPLTSIPLPYFTAAGREGIICITVDDYDIDYALDVARVLEKYGYRMTLFVYQTGAVTVTDYAGKIRALVRGGAYGLQGGHEVGVHSYSHPQLTSLATFTVSCSDASATMSIVTNTTGTSGAWTGTLTTTTTAGGAPDLSINLASSAYDTVGELCTYIASQTGYTCTRPASMSVNAKSTILANVSGQSITGTGYSAQADQGAFFATEISDPKTWLEGVIGGGYVVRSFAPPGGITNAAVKTAVQAAGYIASRGDSVAGSYVLGNLPIYAIYHLQISTIDGDAGEAATKRLAASWAESFVHHGLIGAMLAHSASETTNEQWRWICDVLKKSNVSVLTIGDAASRIRGSGLWATADGGVTWTRTWTNNADYHLTDQSPLIDAGINVGLTQDFDGLSVPYSISPDIGPYEARPSYIYSSKGRKFIGRTIPVFKAN